MAITVLLRNVGQLNAQDVHKELAQLFYPVPRPYRQPHGFEITLEDDRDLKALILWCQTGEGNAFSDHGVTVEIVGNEGNAGPAGGLSSSQANVVAVGHTAAVVVGATQEPPATNTQLPAAQPRRVAPTRVIVAAPVAPTAEVPTVAPGPSASAPAPVNTEDDSDSSDNDDSASGNTEGSIQRARDLADFPSLEELENWLPQMDGNAARMAYLKEVIYFVSKYQYWERRCCDLGKSTADEEEPEGWGDDGDCGGGGGGGDYRVHEAFATAPVTDADLESSPQFLRSLRELLGFVKGFVRVPPHVVLKVQEQVGCGGDVNEALTLLHDTLATRRYVQLQLLSHSRAEADAELARKAAAGGEDARAMIAQLQALESSEHGGFSGQIQKKMEEVATVQRAIKSDAAPILDRHALDPLRHTAEADFVKLLPVSGGGKKAAAAAIGGSGGAGDSCGARAMEVDGGGGDGGGASAAAISSELTLEWDALQEVFDSYARQAEREERKAARQARRGGGDAAAGAADDGDDDGSSDGGYDSDSSSDSLFEAKGDHPAPHPDDPEHDKIVREAEREAVQRLMEKRKKTVAVGDLTPLFGAPGYEDVLVPTELLKLARPHQVEGIRFMSERVLFGLLAAEAEARRLDPYGGGILAHHQGLGKTFQVLVLLVVIACHEQLSKEITHTIITAPKNVIDNWKKEAERYLDGLRVDKLRSKDFFVMDGSSLKPILDWAKAPKGILVIGHVMLAKKMAPLLAQLNSEAGAPSKRVKKAGVKASARGSNSATEFSAKDMEVANILRTKANLLVVDEAHVVSNESTELALALRLIQAGRRIGLTGYPLMNRLLELYTMLSLVTGVAFMSKALFNSEYIAPIEQGRKSGATPEERRAMVVAQTKLNLFQDAIVHRKGADVLVADLPPKNEVVVHCRASELQWKMVEAAYKHVSTSYATRKSLQAAISDTPGRVLEHCIALITKAETDAAAAANSPASSHQSTPTHQAAVAPPVAAAAAAAPEDGDDNTDGEDVPLAAWSRRVKKEGDSSPPPATGAVGGRTPPVKEIIDLCSSDDEEGDEENMDDAATPANGDGCAAAPAAAKEMTLAAAAADAATAAADVMETDGAGAETDAEAAAGSKKQKKKQASGGAAGKQPDKDSKMRYITLPMAYEIIGAAEAHFASSGCELPAEPASRRKWLAQNVVPNAKENFTFSVIREAAEAGEKTLVFACSVETLLYLDGLVGKRLGADWVKGKNYDVVHGQSKDRSAVLEKFRESPDMKVLFLSTEACGIGINLVEATREVIFDQHFNPCYNAQAVGRAWRYGQTKPVHVYLLVTAQWAEEQVFAVATSKEALTRTLTDRNATRAGDQYSVSLEGHVNANLPAKPSDLLPPMTNGHPMLYYTAQQRLGPGKMDKILCSLILRDNSAQGNNGPPGWIHSVEPYCDAFCADDAPPLSEEELVTVLEDGRQRHEDDDAKTFAEMDTEGEMISAQIARLHRDWDARFGGAAGAVASGAAASAGSGSGDAAAGSSGESKEATGKKRKSIGGAGAGAGGSASPPQTAAPSAAGAGASSSGGAGRSNQKAPPQQGVALRILNHHHYSTRSKTKASAQ